MKTDITKTFSNLFNETSLDSIFVNFILETAVNNESDGSANIFAEYRNQLKNLYKSANTLLFNNTKNALGVNNDIITYPLGDIILTGNSKLISKNIHITDKSKKITYPQSAIEIDDFIIPILPYKNHQKIKYQRAMFETWIRTIVSKIIILVLMEI